MPVKTMSKRYAVFCVSAFLAIPLWLEFYEPNQLLWNVFLTAFLIAVVAAIFFGLRYLQKDCIAVGEARFMANRHDVDDS